MSKPLNSRALFGVVFKTIFAQGEESSKINIGNKTVSAFAFCTDALFQNKGKTGQWRSLADTVLSDPS